MTLKIWLSGDWSIAPDLRRGLESAYGFGSATDAEHADVVVHAATGVEPRDELAQVQEHTHAPVVLLVPPGATGLLEATLEADLADVLVLPQPAEAVLYAIRRATVAAARRALSDSHAHITTVFSPKGGTGKSVVSCNLAAVLAERGQRVLLVDLDLQFGDVAIMLAVEPERTLHDLLTSPGSLDSEKIAGYAVRHKGGFDVLAAPLKPEDAESISDSRIAELLDAARTGYDAVIVDTSPFFHGAVLATLDRTDTLLMLCTPDVPTLKNVKLTLQTLELLSFSTDKVRLVLNRANARVGFRASQIASVLEHGVTEELPDDETVAISVNRGEAAVLFKPTAPFSQAVATLASHLGAGAPPQPAKKRFALKVRA
jgi:pilus assembly protein CpaE